jgi:hypothetical protein
MPRPSCPVLVVVPILYCLGAGRNAGGHPRDSGSRYKRIRPTTGIAEATKKA